MDRVWHNSSRTASLRLARAVSHIQQAGQQISAAINVAPDRYHQQRLRRLEVDLRELSSPIAGLATILSRGGGL